MAILTMARHRFYKNDGSLNAGGKVWTYVAGTTTPAATYTSSDASTPNTNPIILNSKGECDLWITGQIKINVLESDDTQVTGWPVDNVGSGVANNDATMRWAGTAAGTANALTITPSPAIAAYVIGQSFIFKAGASPNSAATTIAISGLTPIAAQISGSALAGGEILANKWYSIVLDSLTTCQVEPVASAALAGSASQAFSVAAASSAAHAVRKDQTALSCAFIAYKSANTINQTGDGTEYTIIYDTELADRGANYNNATGVFTAPVTGLYRLTARCNAYNFGAAHTTHRWKIITSNRAYISEAIFGSNPLTEQQFDISILADMDAGDTAYSTVTVSGSTKTVSISGSASAYTSFSGELV